MPKIPDPAEGLVIRYDYLWAYEHQQGRDTSKDRPACVVLVIAPRPPSTRPDVYIAPITHSPPSGKTQGIEVPPAEKRRLGLDDKPSWIIVSELNIDIWPYGLSPATIEGSVAYGRFSHPFLVQVIKRIQAAHAANELTRIKRN